MTPVHFLPLTVTYKKKVVSWAVCWKKSVSDTNKQFLLIDCGDCRDCLWRKCQSKHRRWLDLDFCRSVVAGKISFQENVSNCYAGKESHQTQPWQPPSDPDLNKQKDLLLTQFLWLYSKQMWFFCLNFTALTSLCLLQSSSINYINFLNISKTKWWNTLFCK